MRSISGLFVPLFFVCFKVFGQAFTVENYYMFPINPGQTNYLAGTMGEMRGTHFHGGIDIRTGGKIGLPVYAAADGYVSRVRVQIGGYGHSLYVRHPNGTTTVYAHLDRFSDYLEKYLIDKQYELESYAVNLFPESSEFPIKKGEVIAYSGNTGSSSGPHLHFEIRDQKQRILDPLKFGFDEVKDQIRPRLVSVSFTSLDGDARVNGAFGSYEFATSRQDQTFRITKPLSLKGNIGIAINYRDTHNGSSARNGIPEILMTIDGDTAFHQRKSRMSFSKMRNIVVHMDYGAYTRRRRKLNKLYRDEGNKLDIYLKTNDGIYFDDSPKEIGIYLIDAYGNRSSFLKVVNQRRLQYPLTPVINDFEILDNFMHIQGGQGGDESLSVLANGLEYQKQPYTIQGNNYYLWDLTDGLPDLIVTQDEVYNPQFLATVPSGQNFQFYHKDVDLSFQPSTLFDTLYLRFEKEEIEAHELFKFFHGDFPLRRNVSITLKPERTYDTEKAHVYARFGKQLNYVGGEWENGKVKFKTRDLVTFTIDEDHAPPTITPIKLNTDRVVFVIDDKLSGISHYTATLQGKWLLMKYDKKRKRIWSQLPDENMLIEGEVILEVFDNAGNSKTIKKIITNS